ncbi:MAG: SRPBCC family protein [Parvularculaceae bacterium]
MPSPIPTSATLEIDAPLSQVFEAACGFDIPFIIRSRGIVPGVLKVEEHKGRWSAVGQKRLLTLTDGSSVREELTEYAPNVKYSYRVSGFTGPFAALVSEGRGDWHFTMSSTNRTRIDWTYAFKPKGAASGPAVWFIVKILWPGYMRAALERLKQDVEARPRAAA